MTGTIKVANSNNSLTIDIEGVIGVPEWLQFDDPEDRVATYEKFTGSLKAIKESNAKEVLVNIRSTGGDVNDALLIYDALADLDAEVVTHCYGYVASAATIVAQAASTGKRVISSNSLYLIHQSSSVFEGNAEEIEGGLQLLRQTDERIANIYANRAGKNIADFVSLMGENNGRGRWLSPSEVVDAGLADQVMETKSITNASLEDVRAMKLQDIPTDRIIKPNINNMKYSIKNTFTKILNVLGITPAADKEATEVEAVDFQKVENKLSEFEIAVTNLTTERDNALAGVDTLTTERDQLKATSEEQAVKITNLQAQLGAKESELMQLKTGATTTKEREDPPVDNEAKLTGNQRAYAEDAKVFM